MDIYIIEESAAIKNGHDSIIFENCTGKKDSNKCSVLGSSLVNVHGPV